MAKSKGTFVVPRNFDHEGKRFATKVNESIAQLKGEIGNPLDSAVTFRDLIDAGIAKRDIRIGANGNIIGGGTGDIVIGDEEVLEIPPAPTGVSADGAFQNIVIEWDVPTFFGFSHAEVWAATTSNFADRVFIGQTTAAVFSHQVGNGQTRYYWIRFVNIQDTVGPFNSTTGTQASTAPDIAALMTELSEELQDLPGYTALTTLITNADVAVATKAANVIRATSSPTTRTDGSSLQIVDIWVDTDDNNQVYIRNSSNNGWEKARDSSLISLYNTLSSTVSTNSTNIATAQSDIVTLTTANSSRVSEITELEATLTGFSSSSTVTAAITAEQTARANADSSLSTDITNLTSTVNSNTSAISSEATTRANADSALATDITNLTSTVNSNTSAISSEATTRANADSALATDITNLTTTVNGNSSSITTLNTTTANINGDLNAMYVLQVATETNGSVSAAGMVLGSNAQGGSGAQSYVQFQADKFAIWNGSSNIAPFIVSGGTVFIKDAMIQDGAITNAKIGTAAIDEAKIATAAITEAKIGTAEISEAKIQDAAIARAKIQDLAVNNAKINDISALKITADQLDSSRINVDTLNVRHFDNVSTDIKSHLTGGTTFVPLGRSGQNYVQRTGTYTGSNASFIPVTITQVRNNATYIVIFSGVLGDVSGGRVQYSLNNSTWVNANGNTNISWSAGTYRGYTYVYTGRINTLSASQSTVYWRVYFSGSYNHTQLSLNVIMDNTQ